MQELLERQNRRSNVIIMNVREPVGRSNAERSADDIQTVNKIFEEAQINKNGIQIRPVQI